MTTRFGLAAISVSLALASAAAHAQAQRPMIDAAASKVVQKYQSSSCEELAAARQAPKAPQKEAAKQRIGELLRRDPQARQEFVSQVAAPIADKMIVCGFIP